MDLLIEQEIALHKFETRTNKAEIERLLHPEFREVGKSGNSYDFQSIIELMDNEEPLGNYIHSQDYECVELEHSVMLLLYKSATIDNLGTVSHFAKRSSIWILNETQWKMKYHQGTACEPFQIIDLLTNSVS